MTKTSFPTNLITTNTEVVFFNVNDSRGRQIGSKIERLEADWIETPEGKCGYIPYRRGRWFGFQPHATRDSKRYGPSQPWRWFATVEECEAAIAKYLSDARKRATKIK